MLLFLRRLAPALFVVAPLAGLAQKAATLPDTAYYSATAERLPSPVGAVRRVVTTAGPSGGMVQRISTIAGQRLEEIPYADLAGKVRSGVATSWYATGELKGRRVYQGGQLNGQFQVFYPSGTLQQLEFFEGGTGKNRQCFDESGSAVTCPTDIKRGRLYARYRRGPLQLEEEVSRAVRRLPLPDGSTGERVIVACMVGIDGQIHETRVYKSVGPDFDREALRVASNLRWGWTPELQDNEPIESFYMVNVDFLPVR